VYEKLLKPRQSFLITLYCVRVIKSRRMILVEQAVSVKEI